MKKILYLIAISAAAVAMSTSCSNLNNYPVFDDANAFVSFGKVSVTVPENAGYAKIPIVLSSVAGISTTVSYELVDGEGEYGAKAGIDFIVPDDCTATFDAEHRIDTITIQIIDRPQEYTKDLNFSVKITETGSVTDGAANQCTVTITDLDHPLSSIIGTYTATSANGNTWSMTLYSDESDDTMIWIEDIGNFASGGWPLDQTMFYGVANIESNSISIPIGQESEFIYDAYGVPITLCTTDGASVYYGGNPILGSISEDGNRIELTCDGMTGIMPALLTDDGAAYIGWEDFPIVLTK